MHQDGDAVLQCLLITVTDVAPFQVTTQKSTDARKIHCIRVAKLTIPRSGTHIIHAPYKHVHG